MFVQTPGRTKELDRSSDPMPTVDAVELPQDAAGVPIIPSAAQPRRPKPMRIARRRYLWTASLDPAQRSDLADRLYGIYRETVYGDTRDDFDKHVLGTDSNTRLALFYGADDELAGFFSLRIEQLQHGGRRHAVFCGALCFRRNYRGGLSAQRFGLRHALLFKLRQPRTPLALLTRCSSPAIYRLVAGTMPRLYPNRRYRTPQSVEQLVREFSAQRQYAELGECPWVVRSAATPHDASRLRRLEHDPDVRFYSQLNPRFAQGEALLTWMPLDVANIVGGIFRTLRARVGR